MSLLHFDVIYGPAKVKFAKVDVKSIGELTASKPIHGYLTLFISWLNSQTDVCLTLLLIT